MTYKEFKLHVQDNFPGTKWNFVDFDSIEYLAESKDNQIGILVTYVPERYRIGSQSAWCVECVALGDTLEDGGTSTLVNLVRGAQGF